MRTFIDEFKQFALRGNMIDLAVGIIIGAAFNGVVNSLVKDVIMPPIGYIVGGVNFSDLFIVLGGGSYATLADAQQAGAATINYGNFINSVINLLIVALSVFLLVRGINRLTTVIEDEFGGKKEEVPSEPVNKECPYCLMSIPYKATRCPNCTSQLEPASPESA